MNILYYSWQENSSEDMLKTLQDLGHSVTMQTHELSYYFSAAFKSELQAALTAHPFHLIFTFNFIPSISDGAELLHVPYVSWVYDCPHIPLYTDSLHNSYSYIFLFDRNMQLTALRNQARHAYHHPLAVNASRLPLPDCREDFFPLQYEHDISFIGSLYEKTDYEYLKNVPPHLQGYLHGIISAQKQIWGQDIISPSLSFERVAEIYPFFPFVPSAGEFLTAKDVYVHLIQKQVTSEERIEAVNRLSGITPVALYTASDTSLCSDAVPMGVVSYTAEAPAVFYRSKINLNITLRSITSGIPLRALDILGSGGFLLSNYQPELCEFFTPNIDFVYFEDMKDLEEKAAYYLTHPQEREDIAYHGYQTAKRLFTYRKQVQRMLDTVEASLNQSC